MKKWTKKQKEMLKVFWASAMEAEERYLESIDAIEKALQSTLPEVENLEFFWVDGQIVGIGNKYAKKEHQYELLQTDDLER